MPRACAGRRFRGFAIVEPCREGAGDPLVRAGFRLEALDFLGPAVRPDRGDCPTRPVGMADLQHWNQLNHRESFHPFESGGAGGERLGDDVCVSSPPSDSMLSSRSSTSLASRRMRRRRSCRVCTGCLKRLTSMSALREARGCLSALLARLAARIRLIDRGSISECRASRGPSIGGSSCRRTALPRDRHLSWCDYTSRRAAA